MAGTGAGRAAPALAALAALPLLGAAPGGQRAEPCGADARDPRILVRVEGARSGAGEVAVTLYGADPDAFLARGGRLARVRLPLAGARGVEACFAVPSPGTYAVAAYHDENGDRDFNRTLLGLPAEGYGFSRDAPTLAGLPAFRDVAFAAGTGSTRLVVTLRY